MLKRFSTSNDLSFLDQVEDAQKVDKFTELNGFKVRITSTRLYNFKIHGITCVSCGITGSLLAVEGPKKGRPHVNMYGFDKDGNEVLMTKDHVIPKSKGGANHISNMQTMCITCNMDKGNKH